MKFIKPKTEPVFLESLDDISAYAWSKMQEENELNWLVQGYNGKQTKIKDDRLVEIRKKLEDEAFKLMANDNFNSILNKRMLIYDYATKYDIVKTILDRMWLGFSNEQMEARHIYIKQLSELGFKMPVLNSVMGDKKELERLYQQVEGFKTKINLLIDDIKVDGKKVTRSLNKEMMIVGQILKLGYMLDSKVISQSYWIELQKTAQEISENTRRKE